MPLYGDRLFTSDTWLLASAEGKVAALALWWAAFKQAPAGSVPDNDRILAQLAGYGVAVKAWQAIREEAMRGWVRCSDGRLYHKVVAELAMEAWDRRVRDRDRKAKWRNGRSRTGHGQDADSGGDGTRTETGTGRGQDAEETVLSALTGQDRTGQDYKKDPLTPTADAAGEPIRSSIDQRPPSPQRGTRASGTSPRQIAAAAKAAAPPPPEPDHELWPAMRGFVPAGEFRIWVGPLTLDRSGDRPRLYAPTKFHRDHVMANFDQALRRALGGGFDVEVRS
jgi:hypothetical protein